MIPGARIVSFGHMGDGNLHYNITQPIGADKEAFLARWGEVNARVHGIVRAYKGSISAEHGIGQLKRKELSETKSPVALDLMRRIKASFDPAGIMNPGQVICARCFMVLSMAGKCFDASRASPSVFCLSLFLKPYRWSNFDNHSPR